MTKDSIGRFAGGFVLALLWTLMGPSWCQGGEVRVSFLNDTNSLADTIRVLTNNGCAPENAVVFRRVVERYYREGFKLDLSKFPSSRDGFYAFSTMSDLMRALPGHLCETEHSWDFNCVDTLVVLAHDHFGIGIGPDENFLYMIPEPVTNGQDGITLAATARDAFSRITAEWYRESTVSIIPAAIQDRRMLLTAELFRWHLLPESTSDTTVEREVWSALRLDWARARLTFPKEMQVVLYHKAVVASGTVCTAHMGLLLRRGTAFTYIEKAGGQGPFVRLDFNERRELEPWNDGVWDEPSKKYGTLFMSFNDAEIVKVSSPVANWTPSPRR